MKIENLGTLDRPVLLFGGVYGNVQALEAILERAARLDARLVCTGDIVAYCADAEACCQIFRQENISTIAGNCERNLAGKADDCGCGFLKGSTCERLSGAWFSHAQKGISDESRGWMTSLPDYIRFSHRGKKFGVLHGGVRDIAAFIWPVSPAPRAEFVLAQQRIGPLDMVIAGHCGLAFRQGSWLNAGAVGMPPNDGAPATRYAVLENGCIRFERLEYDHLAARRAMEAAGLVQGYERALSSGYWLSEDMLSKRLRRGATG